MFAAFVHKPPARARYTACGGGGACILLVSCRSSSVRSARARPRGAARPRPSVTDIGWCRRSDRSQAVPRSARMFKTGEEAYEYRRGTWAERQAREAHEAQERQRAGEGVSCPLSRVPEIDR